MTTALAARYEVMTQDISSMMAENESCMWGSATLVMLVSRTCITVTSITENVMAHFRADPMGASLTGRRQGRAWGPPPVICRCGEAADLRDALGQAPLHKRKAPVVRGFPQHLVSTLESRQLANRRGRHHR